MSTSTISPEYLQRLNEAFALAHPRPPSYRYFQRGHGPMFCWTTERMEDGKFQSFVYRPAGKGARSNKATDWELDERSIVAHTLRKKAKDRALRLYRKTVPTS